MSRTYHQPEEREVYRCHSNGTVEPESVGHVSLTKFQRAPGNGKLMAYYIDGGEQRELLGYCDYGNRMTLDQARAHINSMVRQMLSARQLVMREDF